MEGHPASRRGLSGTQVAGLPPPRVSDSVAVRWGPQIGISNKFPGDAEAARHSASHCPLAFLSSKLQSSLGHDVV